MNLPTDTEIEKLHKKYSPSQKVFELVFTHSNIVREIAEQIMSEKKLDINQELVHVGTLLHDIGAYSLITPDGVFDGAHYIQHGVRGYAILKQEGFPEEICRFADHHTGVGISKEEIVNQHLNIPVADYIADTLEEKLIMYTDKFHSKKPQFNKFETYRKYVRRFGEDKVQKFDELSRLFDIPDLEPLVQKFQQKIV